MSDWLHPFGYAMFGLLLVAKAQSATFNVTDVSDTTNTTSLRGAIIEANRLGGTNTILLPQSVYYLTIVGADEDSSLTGDLDVTTGSLTIIAHAASNVVITATGLGDRVFQVLSNAQLTLSNLTITGGACPDGVNNSYEGFSGIGGTGGEGGGICNAGLLMLENCFVSGNRSGSGGPAFGGGNGGAGGGIYNSGFLLLQDCTVSGNSSGRGGDTVPMFPDGFYEGNPIPGPGGSAGAGGGIYNLGTATLIRCNVIGNTTGAGGNGADACCAVGGPGGDGGGICNHGDVNVIASTVSENTSGPGNELGSLKAGPGGSGGGVCNEGNMILNTSTLVRNSAGRGGGSDWRDGLNGGTGGSGGAIYNKGKLSVNACTITRNSAGAGGMGGDFEAIRYGGHGGDGGGIFNAGDGSAVDLHNTLLALNTAGFGGLGVYTAPNAITYTNLAASGIGADLAGSFISKGHNLLGQGDQGSGLTNGSNGDLVGTASVPLDPVIGPPQLNSGTTVTCALLPASPAIDAGDRAGLPATDQRDYPRWIGVSPDIGAYEYWPPASLHLSPSGVDLSVTGVAGQQCGVQVSSNLTDWLTITNRKADTNGVILIHENGIESRRFYRATITVAGAAVLAVTTAPAAIHGSATNLDAADIVSSAITAKISGGVVPYQIASWDYCGGSNLIVPTTKNSLATTFHATVPYGSKLSSSYRLKVVDAADNVEYGPSVAVTLINVPASVPPHETTPSNGHNPYLP